MPVLEAIETVQDQILETIGSVQSQVLKTNKKLATQVNDKFGERVPTIPDLPLVDSIADRIPTPSVAVDTYFDLVERATKANRKFATELVSVWYPAKKQAKTAATKKATVKTAATKKTTAKATSTKRATRKPARKTVAKAVSTDTKK